PDGGTAPTITHDTAVGNPDNGSAKITVTFTDYGQSVIVSGNINPWVNLTGKTVTAKLRLDTGSGAFTNGYTNFFAASGASYVWGAAGGPALTAGTWADLSLNADTAKTNTPTFDPTQVRQIGVQI